MNTYIVMPDRGKYGEEIYKDRVDLSQIGIVTLEEVVKEDFSEKLRLQERAE